VVEHQNYDLVVFSHLRWEFVTQRPQHILKRLARHGHQILFVEEAIPFSESDRGTARVFAADDHINVLQPKVESKSYEQEVYPLIRSQMDQLGLKNVVLWFYSAFFEEFTELIDHQLVVYDCMDELSAFAGAAPELIKKEKKLFKKTDVVFTGGKSLFESKKKHHRQVYCFPSSVDEKDFRLARLTSTQVPEDLANIPGPRVGFYGVIDERVDLELLEQVARKLPKIAFVMIGPVVKIQPELLPRLKNIHYLGAKSYQDLPAYLKGIDIAMMPFALNKSTQFISPTKTLEFMAANKPIISTPIYDVRRDYSQEVKVVSGVKEFVSAVEDFLAEKNLQRRVREKKQELVIKKTSWDLTVQKMEEIMDQKISPNLPSSLDSYSLPIKSKTTLSIDPVI
jgi:glycosyltransferase involved in cell wall biosynthesis